MHTVHEPTPRYQNENPVEKRLNDLHQMLLASPIVRISNLNIKQKRKDRRHEDADSKLITNGPGAPISLSRDSSSGVVGKPRLHWSITIHTDEDDPPIRKAKSYNGARILYTRIIMEQYAKRWGALYFANQDYVLVKKHSGGLWGVRVYADAIADLNTCNWLGVYNEKPTGIAEWARSFFNPPQLVLGYKERDRWPVCAAIGEPVSVDAVPDDVLQKAQGRDAATHI